MQKRLFSLFLAVVMVFSLIPASIVPSYAEKNDEAPADADALTALGIDTSKAPDGFDKNSTENPYGRDTITLTPVYELYSVGLSSEMSFDSSYEKNPADQGLHSGEKTEDHLTAVSEINLVSNLYGHEKWGDNAKTAEKILDSAEGKNIFTGGTTTSKGRYAIISKDTISDPNSDKNKAMCYLTEPVDSSTDFSGFKYAMSQVASGNFDGNKDGLRAQTVMVYTSDYSGKGGLYLRFGSAVDGTYGSNSKELIANGLMIGNPNLKMDGKLVENFAQNPYQLSNYLQVATGDWNGDGIDEVAVYVPEPGNKSRIEVYALKKATGDNADIYKNAEKWERIWTYNIKEADVVSNMVSLVSGDVNMDGIDDLACTWGYYYGPNENKGSTAVVMFGAKGTKVLGESQQFDLKYGSSNIVRASFVFGDMMGAGKKQLILCGQSDADLKGGNTQSRYVALYNYDGKRFASNISKNFDLFEKDKDGKYAWPVMAGRKHGEDQDKFYSLPLTAANTAMISLGIKNKAELLYFDSLVFEFEKEKGLNLKEPWDLQSCMQEDTKNPKEYVEYGAVSGDITGQIGAYVVATMHQTLLNPKEATAKYKTIGEVEIPKYIKVGYYKNWFHKLIKKKSYRWEQNGTQKVNQETEHSIKYNSFDPGKVHMVVVDPSTEQNSGYYFNKKPANFSTSICLANTDKDSSYMNYSGKHYYTYTDPNVLAVLASPPYFEDLLGRNDLSGNYAESTTSYSKSKGQGSGAQESYTLSLGTYFGFEQEFSVFGVKVASAEMETTMMANMTWENSQTSTLEQTITYNATSGEDMVAFYSIPMEIYEYKSYIPQGDGTYKELLTTVNVPHEAAVKLISLKAYENIAKDYSVLPKIENNVLTHRVGDPSSYPSSTAGLKKIAEYEGTPAAVGFSTADGGSSITQELTMSKENESAFSSSASLEAKVGAGAGGFKAGVIAGFEGGSGKVNITTSGSSFSGDIQNMPIEAQSFGYGMNWRIFAYEYNNGKMQFPVVSYIVTDVSAPASLPDDFEQNIAETTDNSITLNWSYDKNVAGFKLYRFHEFPDGSGKYEIAFVPIDAGKLEDGIYKFSYKDENLNPYTEYKYQIQTVQSANPDKSIYSEPMVCRTKTKVGYPVMSYSGLEEGKLPIYPDSESVVTVNIENSNKYKGLDYQWQKLVGTNWKEVPGAIKSALTIKNAGAADDAYYRCRVNAIYYNESAGDTYYISAYSEPVKTAYFKRSPKYQENAFIVEEIIDSQSGIKSINASVELHSANKEHTAAPTGHVKFVVSGKDYKYEESKELSKSSQPKVLDGVNRYYSSASLNLSNLQDGVYTVSVYYSGSRVFKDLYVPEKTLVVGNAISHNISLTKGDAADELTEFVYGDSITARLMEIKKEDGNVSKTPVNATFKISKEGNAEEDFNTDSSNTLDVGKYKITAYVTEEGGAASTAKASQTFVITKRPVTIKAEGIENGISAGDSVVDNPPKITGEGLSEDELSSLKLGYVAVNSAGKETKLDKDTYPGNYTVTAVSSNDTPEDLYNNYNITFISGTYTIIGATYELTVNAAKYKDASGERPVGKAGIVGSEQSRGNYARGTVVTMYAEPQPGYEVDKWIANFEGNLEEKTQLGGTTYNLSIEPYKTNVTVSFKPSKIQLTTSCIPEEGGEISCEDEYFSSGAVVSHGAEYVFTAVPKQGYHFKEWKTSAGGKTQQYPGTVQDDGKNTLSVTVDRNSMTVYAVFERDTYTLNLSGDIRAYYLYDHDGDSTTDKVEKEIVSGDKISGDTEIIVKPKTGYLAKTGEVFEVDGEKTDSGDGYTFQITKNTNISLKTERQKYDVTLEAENGKITAVVDGSARENLNSVPGGAEIKLTARADRGYVFEKWVVDDEEAGAAAEYTVSALGANMSIKAVFAANADYTAKAEASPDNRGEVFYTLHDTYGALVAENQAMPSEGVTVYKGEKIEFIVKTKPGSMMEQWFINDDSTYTTSKKHIIENITYDVNAVAYLKAATNYMAYYAGIGSDGQVITDAVSAECEGAGFESGATLPGGSELCFVATPTDGKMLDYWTVTKGDITAQENQDREVNSDGEVVIDPELTVESLRGNIAVRAHFKDEVQKTVTLVKSEHGNVQLEGATVIKKGDAIEIAEDQDQGTLSVSVREDGNLKLKLTPNDGYAVDGDKIKEAANDNARSVDIISDGESAAVSIVIKGIKDNISILDDLFYAAHKIETDAEISTSKRMARSGEIVNITVNPPSGKYLSRLKAVWMNGNEEKELSLSPEISESISNYSFEMPDAAVKITAVFEKKPNETGGSSGSGDSGGSGGGTSSGDSGSSSSSGGYTGGSTGDGSSISTSDRDTVIKHNGLSLKVADKKAVLVLEKDTFEKLSNLSNTAIIDVESLGDISELTIPDDIADMIENSNVEQLVVNLPAAKLVIDAESLNMIEKSRRGDLTISVDKVDRRSLSADERKLIGDDMVLSIELRSAGKLISDFGGGKVSVSADYTLPSNKKAEGVVVWHLTNAGYLEPVSCHYDSLNRKLTFQTGHFSKFVAGYLPFTDVKREKWYYDSISFAYANKLFSGNDKGEFEPERKMTRAMVVMVLWNIEGKPAPELKNQFTDVKNGVWYEAAVSWASEKGIVNGYSDGRFAPDESITREQLAVMLMKYASYKKLYTEIQSDLNKYTDSVSISPWAREALGWANAKGLIAGVSEDELSPVSDADRATVSRVLWSLFEKIIKK